MSFERYFKLSSYCLISSGFVAIVATGALDLFSILLFGSALVASWFIDTAQLRRRIRTWILNSIALSYFPLYAVDYFLISRSFVLSTVHLIFFIATVKLFTRASDRDYVYLYSISFAQLLAASTLTVNITFGITLFMFFLSAVSTLILFEMKRSNARVQGEGRIQPLVLPATFRGAGLELFAGFPAGSLSWLSFLMAVGIIVIAVPLFLVMPRVSLGIYNRPSGQTQMISGFSETVELGEIGNIKESDVVVMKVKLEESPTEIIPNLKWRGISLDHYDGRSWSRSQIARKRVHTRQFRFFKLEESVGSSLLLHQTFLLEALSTNVVFVSNKALAISDNLGVLERDSSGNLFTARHLFHRIRYSAISDLTQPDPALIPAITASPAPDLSETYLQLPPLDARIADLARRVTGPVPHPYFKAQALERHLKNNYGYSLELRGSPNSSDPLAMFLFDVRKGHCEYFASAMTIMLRQLGIPARLVNGFRAGEYNNLGNSWTVRQYDAHSWVEAFFEPYGWVEFDPTPPDPERSRSLVLKLLSNVLDAVDLWWFEEVVNYDSIKQVRLVRGAREQVLDLQRRIKLWFDTQYRSARARVADLDLRRWISSHALHISLWIAVAAAGGVAVITIRTIRGRQLLFRLRRALRRKDRTYVVVSFYREALGLLESRGMSRMKGQTPLEFALSLDLEPVAEPFVTLTEIYNRIRFGAQHRGEDLSRAETLLTALRKALRKPGRVERR